MRKRFFTLTGSIAALSLVPFSAAQAEVHASEQASLELGDDSGEWAEDGQCDDVRFTGSGMAAVLLTDSIGKDAADCSAALEAGTISVDPMHAPPANDEAILFGDDVSKFAGDGQCDDIRFVSKESAAMVYIAEDIGHDASDCRAAFEDGSVTWQGSSATPELGVTANDIVDQMDAASANIV